MKLIILAFIISISLHLLLFNDYKLKQKLESSEKLVKKDKKANVTFVKIKKEIKPVNKVVVKKTGPIKKRIVKKPVKKVTRKVVKKIPITKKVSKKLIKAPKKIDYKKKRVTKVPSQKKMKTLENKTLEDFLSQAQPVNKKVLNDIERLYGREFETFTKVQKAFIKKNLNTFQQVTQTVLTRLGYPRLAATLRISGINIVEFTFHPNGNISNLRITDSSGYEILDKYSIKLIEIAYKDYPRPKTATKLKFNVQYRLY